MRHALVEHLVLAAALACSAALVLGAPVFAAGIKRDIKGIGLGMTADQILKSATVPCRVNKAQDVSCQDPDGSEYRALMSGGKPSVALSVKHTFCSAAAVPAVLSGILKRFGVPPAAVRPNPNGSSFAITADIQGNLNANAGVCGGGGRTYQLTIRDASLLQMQSDPASGGGTGPLAR